MRRSLVFRPSKGHDLCISLLLSINRLPYYLEPWGSLTDLVPECSKGFGFQTFTRAFKERGSSRGREDAL